MTNKEIKKSLLEGQNFGNEAAGWYSICRPSESLYMIVIGERNLFCKNIDSASKRISKLINTGN
jgi:hypothetical protein